MLAAAFASLGTAHAQSDTSTQPQTVERVTITGSNIRRADTETPSPVQVITVEDIKASGYTDVSDVLRNITANGQGTLSQAFNGAFASGASGVALRGLTVGATLVLIDGRRMAPYALSDDGQRSFVDVSQIPIEAIERIEVLKDGASSIYGSDAVAGVVNIILKRSYIGTEATADVGASYKWDGKTVHTSIISGFGDLDADGHNVYVTLEYRKQDPIYTGDRTGITNLDYTSQGGNNLHPGVPTALNGGYAGSITGYLVNPTSGAISGFLPGCTLTLYNAGSCQYHNASLELNPGTQNIDTLASWTQKLPGDWEFNIKASIFDTHAEQVNNYANTQYNEGGPNIVSYSATNGPTLIQPPTRITVPAGYPGNNTGATQDLVYNFANLGPVLTRVDSQSYRLVGDLTGTFMGWDTTTAMGFTESVIDQEAFGTYSIPALQAALNNPVTPYRLGLNAYLNTPAQNALVSPIATTRDTDILEFINLHASHDIYQLPGGPATIGVGVDYFHRELDAPAPQAFASGVQYPGNNAFAVGNQNVQSAYLELYAPILKNLEVDASGRVDSYLGEGSSAVPKVGFKYTPIDQFTFRGTWSEGFRAPNPAETGPSGQAFFFTSLPDPILCPNPAAPGKTPQTTPGNFSTQCAVPILGLQVPGTDLKPETSRQYTLGFIVEPIKNISASIDYYNINISNQIISAESDPTYLSNFNSVLVRGNPIVAPFVLPNGTTVNRLTPTGVMVYVPFPYENAAQTWTNGVDLDLRLKWDLADWGRLTADLTNTYTFNYKEAFGVGEQSVQLAGTHGPSSISGDTGNPRDRAAFTLQWDRGPLLLRGTVNYISAFSVTDPSEGLDTCQAALNASFEGPAFSGPVPQEYCKVHSFTTFDVYANYKFDKNWSIHGSILNLFNRVSPLDFETYGGGGNSFYDAALEQQGAIGRFFSIGATYKF
jgi:iron complex outermembrane receptor protein